MYMVVTSELLAVYNQDDEEVYTTRLTSKIERGIIRLTRRDDFQTRVHFGSGLFLTIRRIAYKPYKLDLSEHTGINTRIWDDIIVRKDRRNERR